MKIWNESEKDVFAYFQWFNKDEAYKRIGEIPGLSVFSVNGSALFGLSDKTTFIEEASNTIREIYAKQEISSDYKLFLFVNAELKDNTSKIERHKKVWKLLQSKWQLEGFNQGPEIEVSVEEKTFFTSIASFTLESLSMALKVVSSNPQKYTIISSKKNDVLTEKSIKEVFDTAFSRCKGEIDYFNLSINLCPKEDIVFRWGDSSEEAEIAMVFKSELISGFRS